MSVEEMKHYAIRLEEISQELKPLKKKLYQHPTPDFTVEEKYLLRNLLEENEATVSLLNAAVNVQNENNKTWKKLFCK